MALTPTKIGLIALSLALVHCGADTQSPQTPETPMQPASQMGPTSAETMPPPTAEPTEQAATPPEPVTPPAPEPLRDAQISAVLSAANQSEIDQAKLAQKKSKNARVKKYAAMMIKHHGDAQKKHDKLVKKLGLTSEDSPLLSELRSSADSATVQLQTPTGNDFDVAYINAQVQAHQKVLDAIDQRLLPSATDADLKALITELRPTIESHLEEARKISSELSAAPAAGATPAPSPTP